MFIFIGGAPRVGKSILSKKLANSLGVSYSSTDALRWGVKQLKQIPKDDSLFILDRLGEWEKREEFYTKYTPEEMVDFTKQESAEVIKVVKGFIESTAYRSQDFLLEGIALMPSLLDLEFLRQYNIDYFCVGNTEKEDLLHHSWANRTHGDWLAKVDKETFTKVIDFSVDFSKVIKQECKDKDVRYYEISSSSFSEDLEKIVAKYS